MSNPARRALARSLPFRIIGGPQHGRTLWLDRALIRRDGLVHSPVVVKGDDGTDEVVQLCAYAIERDTFRAIFQVEARGQ